MKVQLYRIDKNLNIPKYETPGSFGFDFTARQDTVVEPQSVALVPGNVIVKCPENLALLIVPRSSIYRKKGLVFPHSIGLIDRDYCGKDDEIMIQVFNSGQKAITVERGERIAQGLFVQTRQVEFEEVEAMEEPSRGGFGSTG